MVKNEYEGKEAVIYSRFSPRPNAAECDSCETQEKMIAEWCAKRKIPVASTWADKAVSGGEEDEKVRPNLFAAVAALNSRRILVVYKWDRIARNTFFQEVIERNVHARGSRIVAIADAGNGESAMDRMTRKMIGLFSEAQKEINAERTSAVMRWKQRDGKKMSAKPPYGWMINPADKKTMLPVERERKMIAIILALRKQGLGYHRIAKRLAQEGLVRRSGKDFQDMDIYRIVKRAERDAEAKGGAE